MALAWLEKYGVPKEFADAPAVVLEDSQTMELYATRSTQTRKRRVLVLNQKGFSEADQQIFYDPGRGKLQNFAARTISPDGDAIPVPGELMRDLLFFKDPSIEERVLQFSFPRVKPGAVLEYEYSIKYKYPRFYEWWNVQEEIPVLEKRFALSLESVEWPIAHLQAHGRSDASKWCRFSSQKPAAEQRTDEAVCRLVPAFRAEELSPPRPDLLVRTFLTWDPGYRETIDDTIWRRASDYYQKRIKDCTWEMDEATSVARELAAQAVGDSSKVQLAYEWVQRNTRVRPSAFADDLEGLRGECRNPDEVIQNRGGLADEVTLLTLVLLQNMGVDAYPVLANDRLDGRFSFEIPDARQVQHLLIQIRAEGQLSYLDPSCRFCPPGVVFWRYCGSGRGGDGVLLEENRILPVSIPAMPAQYSSERWASRISLAEDCSAEVEGTVTWQGSEDVQMRRRWEKLTPAARRESFQQQLPGNIENPTVTPGDPEDATENLKVEYRYGSPGMGIIAGDRCLLRPPDILSEKLKIPVQENRRSPIWFPYPFSVGTKAVIKIPEALELPSLPPKKVIEGPGMRFEGAWSLVGDGRDLTWSSRLVFSGAFIETARYPEVREFAARLHEFFNEGLVLGRGGQAPGRR